MLPSLGSLLETLSSLTTDARPCSDTTAYEPDSADVLQISNHRVEVSDDALALLVESIQRVEAIARLDRGVAHFSPNSRKGIQLHEIAHWLLAQSRLAGPEHAVQSLLESLERNCSEVLEVVPVWGIAPKRELKLAGDLCLVPIEAIPPSKLRDLFLGKKRHKSNFDPVVAAPRPGAAFVRRFQLSPLYESAASDAALHEQSAAQLLLQGVEEHEGPVKDNLLRQLMGLTDPKKMVRRQSMWSEVEELSTVVALAVDRPMFPLTQWYQLPINVPLVGGFAGGYSEPINDPPFIVPLPPRDYAYDELEGLVEQYLALDPSVRGRLRTPLKRLNEARRQLNLNIDASAMELGIAIETLLTHDRDHDAPISFLVRTRGTLLLGGDAANRRANYDALKKLYNLRSTVAHKGFLVERKGFALSDADKKRRLEMIQQLQGGVVLCISMIRKIVTLARFPSWDAIMIGCDNDDPGLNESSPDT